MWSYRRNKMSFWNPQMDLYILKKPPDNMTNRTQGQVLIPDGPTSKTRIKNLKSSVTPWVRGLPLMTSAKISDFLTPPLFANSRNLPYSAYYVCF